MKQMENVVSKLRMIGKEPKILSDSAAMIKDTPSGEVVAYKVDKTGKLEELRFEEVITFSSTDKFIATLAAGDYSLFDNQLNIKLKLFSEKPVDIYNGLFFEVKSPKHNTVRILGLDGTPLSGYNATKIKKWKLNDNSIIIESYFLWNKATLDILTFEPYSGYNTKSIGIDIQGLDDNTIDIGSNIVVAMNSTGTKLYEFDFNGRLKLSIPNGRIQRNKAGTSILLNDRFGRKLKEIKQLATL